MNKLETSTVLPMHLLLPQPIAHHLCAQLLQLELLNLIRSCLGEIVNPENILGDQMPAKLLANPIPDLFSTERRAFPADGESSDDLAVLVIRQTDDADLLHVCVR
jgi:hypothetical protein